MSARKDSKYVRVSARFLQTCPQATVQNRVAHMKGNRTVNVFFLYVVGADAWRNVHVSESRQRSVRVRSGRSYAGVRRIFLGGLEEREEREEREDGREERYLFDNHK